MYSKSWLKTMIDNVCISTTRLLRFHSLDTQKKTVIFTVVQAPNFTRVMSKSAIKILWDPTVPWDRWDCPWESTVPGVLSRLAITIPKSCLDIPKFQGDFGMSRQDLGISPTNCPLSTSHCAQSHCAQSHCAQSHCPSRLRFPTRDITVQESNGNMGCPQDSTVPQDTSQSHCSSHPKVPLGLWDILGISLSHQIHHSPTVLPVPKSQGDFGMSSGFPCPTRYITVPLSFLSQSPLGTLGCPRDFPVPPDTSQSHCPSCPKVPRGLRDVLGISLSHQIHHSPTVLPVPKSPWDSGMSSGFPCPTRYITVPLSFPSQNPLGMSYHN